MLLLESLSTAPDARTISRPARFRGLVILGASMAMTVAFTDASYAQWKAVADFSACPRQYIPDTHGEEHGFSTQQQCLARINQGKSQLACAQYQCLVEGTSTSGGTGGDLVNQSTNALVKGVMNGNSQEVGLGLFGLGVNSLLQGMQGDPNEAARQAAERQKQAQIAAAEQQRRAGEAARRAADVKSQLMGGVGAADSAPPPLSGSTNGSDLKLLTSDQLFADNTAGLKPLGGTGTKFFSSGGTTCTVSQDPSAVDLCGLGDKPAVDPSAIKVDPNAASIGGAGIARGTPDAMIRPNSQTATADMARAAKVPASAAPTKQKGTQPSPNGFKLSDETIAKVMPLLRQPDPGRSIAAIRRPAICESLSRQLDETQQLARRAVLASDVYERYEAGKTTLPVVAAFDRVSDNGMDMRLLFAGMNSRAVKDLMEPTDSDYRAAIYRDRTDPKKIFLIFRGTTSFGDFANANLPQGEGLGSAYYKKAIALTGLLKKSAATQGLNLELGGHSLGGGMADAAGVANHVKTTSFNPAGVHVNSLPAGIDMSAARQYVTDYVVAGEPLNARQDHPLQTKVEGSVAAAMGAPLLVGTVAASATSDLVNGDRGETKKSVEEIAALYAATPPPAIGRRVTLAPDPNDASSLDPLKLHYMTSVVDAIVKQSQELYGQYKFNECGS